MNVKVILHAVALSCAKCTAHTVTEVDEEVQWKGCLDVCKVHADTVAR